MSVKGVFSVKVVWTLAMLLVLFNSPPQVFAGPYGNSAHGSTDYGVLRTILNGTYLRGNCGHCHEQHSNAADGYLLIADGFSGKTVNAYSQSDNVCFQCHATSGSVQFGGIVNNTYSTTFGGGTATLTSIMAAFNQASYHNLYDLKRYITGVSGSKTFPNFPAKSNPCSGCHNIHLAKANKRSPGDPSYTALSKPSAHNSLWGDDAPVERMTSYGMAYQPPRYANSSNFEPDGVCNDKAIQAAKTPDYNAFCLDCHKVGNLIYYTNASLKNPATVIPIDWSSGGDKHGSFAADGSIFMSLPYTSGSTALGYVLSCADCHEPHGSPNAALIRTTVNGSSTTMGSNTVMNSDWQILCRKCHNYGSSWKDVHHGSDGETPYARPSSYFGQCNNCHGSPGTQPIPCINCHFHGSTDAWLPVAYRTNRKTF